MVQLVSDERVLEMAKLLEAMCPSRKAQSDGLGKYLGDGYPRPQFKNDSLRTVELEECLRELLVLRSFCRDHAFDDV